ncbi:hypothetical protein CHS0354_027613 [Potamilus streckersoni]|uniref:S phase cyclin A-associated protein in the endoplasmic reticulum n=1 Tax=Potamilus streckersoni TaxID=2493646 RepID=A0AAE0S427_9BIVA|nr:hypothetical protein CHS0354_027613 [Potamilus streckersoni]
MSDTRRKRHSAALRTRFDNGENFHRAQAGSNTQRGRNNNNTQTNYASNHNQFQRMNSSDKVRKIVQEEGRTARNLIIYNVPVEQNRHPSDRSRSRYAVKTSQGSIQKSSIQQKSQNDDLLKSFQKSVSELTKSPRSDGGGKKPDLRARYWKFLFDNLQRAVDAIYETCEQDESVVECKEVIMMLQQSTRDFESLIDRLNVQKAFEVATKEGDRPSSIAWEVRKMSPGKTPGMGPAHTSPSPAQRALNFSHSDQGHPSTPAGPKSGSGGNSWADRVKGIVTSKHPPAEEPSRKTSQSEPHAVSSTPTAISPVSTLTESEELKDIDDDNQEGWETVQRGGKLKARNSPSQRSLENLSTASQAGHDHKLKRSISDSNATVMNNHVKSSKSKDRRYPLNKKSSSVAEIHGTVTLSNSQRNRTGSKDSEKENIPSKGEANNGTSRYSVETDADSVINKLLPENEKSIYSVPKVPNASNTNTIVNAWVKSNGDSIDGKIRHIPDSKEIVFEAEEQEINLLNDVEEKEEDESFEKQINNAMEIEDSLTKQLEAEQDKALQSVIQEEESWLKELAREENAQIEIEIETETESELGVSGNTVGSLDASQQVLDWDAMVAAYDAEEAAGEKKDWGEMVEEADVRTPGHGVHMHEKLSSPSRRRPTKSPTESMKRHEEKQAKAQEQRERLLQGKAERLRDLSKKVEEVRALKEELMRQKKETMEMKMLRAEEKRQLQLKAKAQKAHDEEAKANEIAFINTLEAQNKRHDIMSKHQESEARLQDMQEERQRKLEEKLAKEAAVEERRKALEAERVARLQEMQEKRKQRDARIEQQQQEKEKERQEAFRMKEREREERLAALSAQHEQHIQELQRKIQQKQDESTQRYQDMLQQIREKAFEMSVLRHSTEDHNEAPKITPYDHQKMCTICNALIPSEVYLLSHLRGKKHQQALKDNNSGKTMSKPEIENFNLKHIVDAPDNSTHPKIVMEKERLKSQKKRCKKLKQRMNARGLEYENTLSGKQTMADSEHKAKMQKVVKDINKYLQSSDSGPWTQNKVSALDKALGEISRILDRKGTADQNSYRVLGGLTCVTRVLQIIDVSNPQLPPVIPAKSLVLTSNVFRLACKGCYDNCHHMLFSNKIGVVIDLLINQLVLMVPQETPVQSGSAGLPGVGSPKLPTNSVAVSLIQLLSSILSCLAKHNPMSNSSDASVERMGNTTDAFTSRGSDVISYIISVGIVDKLTQYYRSVQGPIDEDKDAAEFLQHSLGLLVAMTKFMSKRKSSIFQKKKMEDPTQLISTFEVTELVGIVSLLYGMLLHSGTPSRGDATPPEFPTHTIAVATTGLRMLNHMALLDIDMLQKTLGDEGVSLEFRHIASYLIWYCSHHQSEELLHEVVLCVGYFTVMNADNQVVIQSGQAPTVLQQLCSLPFQYFSDPRLTIVLFPTLISCCYNNQANRLILEQELSCTLLSNFIEEKQLEAQLNKIPSAPTGKKDNKDKEGGDVRMMLSSRFPVQHWTAAQEYFKIS